MTKKIIIQRIILISISPAILILVAIGFIYGNIWQWIIYSIGFLLLLNFIAYKKCKQPYD